MENAPNERFDKESDADVIKSRIFNSKIDRMDEKLGDKIVLARMGKEGREKLAPHAKAWLERQAEKDAKLQIENDVRLKAKKFSKSMGVDVDKVLNEQQERIENGRKENNGEK